MTNTVDSALFKITDEQLVDELTSISTRPLTLIKGKNFINRVKPKTFNFNAIDARLAFDLSNRLSLEAYERNLFGVAATQFGIPIRAFAVRGIDEAFFNPTISWTNKEKVEMDEIVPNFPGSKVIVSRSSQLEIRYLDPAGRFKKAQYVGLTARVIQQMVEMVDGNSILDNVSKIRAKQIITKADKIKVKGK